MTARGPRQPTGLGPSGRRLWREFAAAEEFTKAIEAAVLEQACREADLIDRLAEELHGSALLVAGSNGQPRPHPLLGEVRAHRLVLARLLAEITVESEDASVPAGPRSRRAAKAANARWNRQRLQRQAVEDQAASAGRWRPAVVDDDGSA